MSIKHVGYLNFGPGTLCIEDAFDGRVLQALRRIFPSRFQEMASHSDGCIIISQRTDAQPPPNGSDSTVILKQWQLERSRPLWGDVLGPTLRYTDGVSQVFVDYERRNAHLCLVDETVADEDYFERTFLPLALLEVLRSLGWVYMHGAILDVQGTAVALLAPGGQGKSTLTLEALHRGHRVVCDDNFLMRITARGLEVQAFEEVFCLQKRPRVKVPRSHFSPHLVPLSLPLHAVFTLDRTASKARGPDLSKAQLLKHLLTENPLVLTYAPLAAPSLGTLEALCHLYRGSLSIPYTNPLDPQALWVNFIGQVTRKLL